MRILCGAELGDIARPSCIGLGRFKASTTTLGG